MVDSAVFVRLISYSYLNYENLLDQTSDTEDTQRSMYKLVLVVGRRQETIALVTGHVSVTCRHPLHTYNLQYYISKYLFLCIFLII